MKKAYVLFLSIIFALLFTTFNVCADTGPKPQYVVEFQNLPSSSYIVTIELEGSIYGPHEAFDPMHKETEYYHGSYEELNEVYSHISLEEGWFLFDECDTFQGQSFTYESGYMYPRIFKIVLYDKGNEKAMVSDMIEPYAFHSYYSITLQDSALVVKKNYNYGKEIGGFFLRLAITLVVEIGLAFCFRFSKKSYWILGATNVATQIGLNLFLNLSTYYKGKQFTTILVYTLLELGVVAIESVIFRFLCSRGKESSKKWIISYTILANVLSFAVGLLLWIRL